MIFARCQIDFLGVGLLDGVAGGRFQLLDFVPARVHPLQVDLALGVGVIGAQVVVFAGLGIVRTAPDLELYALNGTAGDGIHLFNKQIRLAQVVQFNGGGLVLIQVNSMDGIVRHPAILGLGFLHGISARIQSLQHDQAVLIGKMQLVIAAVDLPDAELDAGKGFAGLLVDFQQAQTGAGAVHEVHHHVLVLGGVDPDGLAVIGVQDIGCRHIDFLHLIAPGGHIGEGGLAVRPRHHIVFIAQVHAPDMEAGARNRVAGLGVPLGDGQAALVMVGLGDYDGLLTLEILGVDMDAHRGAVAVKTSGRVYLAELVVALADVGHGDGAVRLGFLGADDLSIPQDDKNSASQGAAALVHLL